MRCTVAIVLVASCVWITGIPFAQAQGNVSQVPLAQQIQDVAKLLEGSMDTTAQARANPKAPKVRMTTCPVQVTDATTKASIFLYQEQALTEKLSQPYRQRFLEIAPADSPLGAVRSLSFRPAQPDQWIGFCNKPTSQRSLSSKVLGNPVCSVYLKPIQNGYLGVTAAEGCPANVRGAIRITNQVELFPNGMNTWDRGFDATGKQVWGAESEAYQFRRQKE
ncbi:MAG: chromophore lyase CpcT/CpeT [Leptolyngbyaceae cyanobacterium bins.302]|nr:chromophore lyase CpcT/CpeT [Leptolyngbyaceae cyanobacterium bins.302]